MCECCTPENPKHLRWPLTVTMQAFHNDIFCDILAMQTHTVAAKGGNHIIASSWKIYNELAAARPDVLRLLAAPDWPFDM